MYTVNIAICLFWLTKIDFTIWKKLSASNAIIIFDLTFWYYSAANRIGHSPTSISDFFIFLSMLTKFICLAIGMLLTDNLFIQIFQKLEVVSFRCLQFLLISYSGQIKMGSGNSQIQLKFCISISTKKSCQKFQSTFNFLTNIIEEQWFCLWIHKFYWKKDYISKI